MKLAALLALLLFGVFCAFRKFRGYPVAGTTEFTEYTDPVTRAYPVSKSWDLGGTLPTAVLNFSQLNCSPISTNIL